MRLIYYILMLFSLIVVGQCKVDKSAKLLFLMPLATAPSLTGVNLVQTTNYSSIMEGVQPISYNVTLNSQPSSDVTIIISFDSAQLKVNGSTSSPVSLTFTTSNWSTAQTIDIIAVFDNITEGTHTSFYTISATSADSNFTGSSTYSVSITDNAGSKLLSSFQSGTLTDPTNSSTAALGTTVDITKSFVYCNFKLSSSSPTYAPTCQLKSDGTAVEIKTGAATTNANTAIDWYVASFSVGSSVQRGSTTLNSGVSTQNVTLGTAIDTARTFVIAYSRSASGGTNEDEQRTVRARLIAADTLELSRNENTTMNTIVEWQVIQLDGARVQSGIITIANGSSSGSATISAIDLTKSFIIFNSKAGSGVDGVERDYYVRGSYASSTSISFIRNGNSDTVDISWFAIEMADGSTAQSGTVATSGVTTSVTISSVNTGKTMIVMSNRIQTGDSGVTTQDSGTYYARFNSSTQIDFARFNDEGNSGSISWFAVQFQ